MVCKELMMPFLQCYRIWSLLGIFQPLPPAYNGTTTGNNTHSRILLAYKTVELWNLILIINLLELLYSASIYGHYLYVLVRFLQFYTHKMLTRSEAYAVPSTVAVALGTIATSPCTPQCSLTPTPAFMLPPIAPVRLAVNVTGTIYTTNV